MAKAGTEFELFVKAIYEQILTFDGYETVRVEHDVNVLGKSGQLHQIDVYWEFNVAGLTHKVAVECKDYKSNVSVGKIRDFYGALEDIGNIHGIFVTTKGYQSGAVQYAEHKNISLKVVKEPSQEEIDEHLGIKAININIEILQIANSKMTPVFDVQWILENTSIKSGDHYSFNAINNEIKIIDSNYNLLGTVLDFENKLPRKSENEKGLSYKFDFDDSYFHVPNCGYPPLKIKTLKFDYDTYVLNSKSEINFEIMAKAIIKDIVTGEAHLYKNNPMPGI